MIRLPDSYFIGITIPEQQPEPAVIAPSPMVYQGEDAVFSVVLGFEGGPVRPENHILEVFVKKITAASNVLWTGRVHDGLYLVDPEASLYEIRIPAQVTSRFLPGTYTMAISLVERNSVNGRQPRTAFILNQKFQIELSAASPNPGLRGGLSVETVYDPSTHSILTTTTGTEPTLPVPVNIATP